MCVLIKKRPFGASCDSATAQNGLIVPPASACEEYKKLLQQRLKNCSVIKVSAASCEVCTLSMFHRASWTFLIEKCLSNNLCHIYNLTCLSQVQVIRLIPFTKHSSELYKFIFTCVVTHPTATKMFLIHRCKTWAFLTSLPHTIVRWFQDYQRHIRQTYLVCLKLINKAKTAGLIC